MDSVAHAFDLVICAARMDKKDLPALTGIRFIAASMVFLFHYADYLFSPDARQLGYYFFRQLNVGVSLFFVLSGFLITYRYYDVLSSGKPLGAYFIRRVARIFPLYWLVLFLHFSSGWMHGKPWPDLQTFFLNLTLLHGFSARYFFSGLTQSWSLTVEESFYLYSPFCFWLIRTRKFFYPQIFLLLGSGFLLSGLTVQHWTGGFFGDTAFLLSGSFFGRCFEFFAGMFIALKIHKQPAPRKGSFFTHAGLLLFFLLLAALAGLSFSQQNRDYNASLAGVLLFNFLIPASIAVFYYGLIRENTFIRRWLSFSFVTLLGKSSYAFYLLHIGVVAEIFYYHVSANMLVLYLLLQLTAVFAYKLFEKPVYFFLLRKLGVGDQRKQARTVYISG